MKKQKTVLHLKKFRIANLNRFSIQGGSAPSAPSAGNTDDTVDSNTNPYNTYENHGSCDGAGGMETSCGTEGVPKSLNEECSYNNNNTNQNASGLG